jgi:hypothetical protein
MENLELSRAAEEQAALAEMARLAELSEGLMTPGPVSLTHFAGIDTEHLQVLVDLIEEAMDNYDADLGYGEALTLRCRMRLMLGRPDQILTIETADGSLTAPDLRVDITTVLAQSAPPCCVSRFSLRKRTQNCSAWLGSATTNCGNGSSPQWDGN